MTFQAPQNLLATANGAQSSNAEAEIATFTVKAGLAQMLKVTRELAILIISQLTTNTMTLSRVV
jgi:hypothetical protein